MIGSGEIVVICLLIFVLFGGKKLPEFARNLGQGMREFRSAMYGEESTLPKRSGKDKTDDLSD